MRATLLIVALVASVSGCGVVPRPVARTAGAPTPAVVTSPPASPDASPTPSAAAAGLTAPEARRALREWVRRYNATLRARKWWRRNDRVDALFVEAAMHEAVLERNRWRTR
ncbi:hypothetical protein AAH991_04950 [Microbispora sp. ZYX-F-249]|uniref:Uncharacterized protein n=1 Tax=Microbispora maris TaxID=3144104 RepID=A0ABV0AGH4_9ACTN